MKNKYNITDHRTIIAVHMPGTKKGKKYLFIPLLVSFLQDTKDTVIVKDHIKSLVKTVIDFINEKPKERHAYVYSTVKTTVNDEEPYIRNVKYKNISFGEINEKTLLEAIEFVNIRGNDEAIKELQDKIREEHKKEKEVA